MLQGVERCDQCGFAYDENTATTAAAAIRAGAAQLTAILADSPAGLPARREPGRWSPLEYACHVRDMLLVQRERLLAARRPHPPACHPIGRDERVAPTRDARPHPA